MSAAPPVEQRPFSRVSVCAATFRRPAGLERLLRALGELRFTKSPRPELEVVIVDNDPDASARALCERLAGELPWPLRYAHEPRRGISFARNRALGEAADHARLVAFIDDDEVPEPNWLDELLHVRERFSADVVTGPVIPYFEGGQPPAWVEQGGFFDHPRHQTGQTVPYAATNNVLFDLRVLRDVEPAFDTRYALTGGEDVHFFLRVARAGYRMVWADEARVQDWIPESRTRARWVLQRAYRIGTNWAAYERELKPPSGVALHVAKGVARIGHGVLLLPLALPFGKRALVRSGEQICEGIGNLAGLAGVQFQEYRTTHGK